MKLVINMEKPNIITTEPQKQTSTDVKNSTAASIKVIAIAVSAVCIAVAVVAGFVFAFKYNAETTANIIKREIPNTPDRETVEENLDDNTKLYTVYRDQGTQFILYDFNRKMKLVKTENSGRCIVTAMNHTERDVENLHSGEMPGPSRFQVDNEPVHDKSFLSKRGQELCEDDHVYWAMEASCDDSTIMSNSTAVGERSKRDTTEYYSCCGPCYVWCISDRHYTLTTYVCNYFLEVYRVCDSNDNCFCYFYYTHYDDCEDCPLN